MRGLGDQATAVFEITIVLAADTAMARDVLAGLRHTWRGQA